MRINHFSLKSKIIAALFLFIFVLTAIITQLWNATVSKGVESSTSNNMVNLMRISNENLDVALRDIDHLTLMIAANRDIIINAFAKENYESPADYVDDNRKIEGLIANAFHFKKYLIGLTASNLKGRSFSIGDTVRFDVFKEQEWFPSFHSKGKRMLLGPVIYEGKQLISLVRPIMKDNEVIGFAKADIRFDLLLNLFRVNLTNDASIMIVDQSNDWVLKPEGHFDAMNSDELEAIRSQITNKSGTFYETINNRRTFVTYFQSEYTGWVTISLITRENMMEDYAQTRDKMLWIVSSLSIGSLLALYILISILMRNLRKLNKHIKNLNVDNLESTLEIKTNDEVGQLFHQFNRMIQRIKELIDDTRRHESSKRKAEIQALEAQINPHFLYNTLNTIKFLATLQGSDGIRDVSEALSTLMRINMDGRQLITVREEADYLASYIKIQEYKYTGKFITRIMIEKEVESACILKLLLQPLVENALLHGIAPLRRQGILTVRIFREDDNLIVRIEDNGVGMAQETIDRIAGDNRNSGRIGLSNVISRLELNFNRQSVLKILSEPDCFTIVEIRHPLIPSLEVST